MRKSRTLTQRLLLAFTLVGVAPLVILVFVTIKASSGLSENIGKSFQSLAVTTGDLIDRNLFERYGDVQAFGANAVIQDRTNWYKQGSGDNPIVAAANQYLKLYGVYLLSILVDDTGKVIAVSDRTAEGKSIDTTWIYKENFKDAEWFKKVVAGEFMSTATLTGTHVDDVKFDSIIQKHCGGSGLYVGFAAPFFDSSGKVIGVWRNLADFRIVEELLVEAYTGLRASGFPESSIQLVDRRGRLIAEVDPRLSGGKAVPIRDNNRVLRDSIANAKNPAAASVLQGVSGVQTTKEENGASSVVSGYAPADGALGYAGLGWGVLVNVPVSQAHESALKVRNQVWLVLIVGILILITAAAFLGNRIASPFVQGLSNLNEGADQVAAASQQVAAASQTLADGASRQALLLIRIWFRSDLF